MSNNKKSTKKVSSDQQRVYIEFWSKVVETQMHFNEMSVKSRQLGLTFVAAALGVAVVLIGKQEDFFINIPLPCSDNVLHLHVAGIIMVAAAGALWMVRTLDLHVYHRMLRGAVAFGEDFEENYMKKYVYDLEKGMTQAISHFSRHDNAKAEVNGTKTIYEGSDKKSAETKIRKFYTYTMIGMVIVGIVIFLSNKPISSKNEMSTINQPKISQTERQTDVEQPPKVTPHN
ncbi:hypothetical protein [Kordiimonas marina]|uniref:hypothetical protein n=1 Tax=Kordiimonas marina TaxID=2872312 RepID=UPI001FF648F9|nr:hypothetical protein [Kordiimonas marina]MCJ9430762.1 hypothetical protein [Kordiimonas marina]